MKFQVLKDAEDELSESVEYYEEIEPGLGIALKEEARTVFQWIRNNPELPRVRHKGYRRSRGPRLTASHKFRLAWHRFSGINNIA